MCHSHQLMCQQPPVNVPQSVINVSQTPVNVPQSAINVPQTPINVPQTAFNVPQTPINVLPVASYDMLENALGAIHSARTVIQRKSQSTKVGVGCDVI